MLLWKDIPPQHFETIFGEYPAHKPKPPMECHPVGLAHEPAPGQEKWRLRPDSSLEVLYPEFQEVVEGGWRNKVPHSLCQVNHLSWRLLAPVWQIFTRDLASVIARRDPRCGLVETWNEMLPLW